jgi:hypothetical protein
MAEIQRGIRARGNRPSGDSDIFRAAVDRRENLDLELRDETGQPFGCAFIRITDLVDVENGVVEEMCETEEEEEARFQIHLSTLSDDAREAALAKRAESNAEIEQMVDEVMAERDEDQMFGSGWPPSPPEDPRWKTMRFLLQAHLESDDWEP